MKYWAISAGESSYLWQEFKEKSIIAIGWDGLGDLREYESKNDIKNKLIEQTGKPDPKNDALANYQFCNDMNIGDKVFVKEGTRKILALGEISSEYIYNENEEYYKSIREVKWISIGEWMVDEDKKVGQKTLTELTSYQGFWKSWLETIGENVLEERNYYWLNANPRIWSFNELKINEVVTYTSRNENGNKRNMAKCFDEAKKGDIVLGFLTNPEQKLISICDIVEGLHKDENDEEVISFRKVRELNNPVPITELENKSGLEECKPLKNRQGSLFPLTKEEYRIIEEIAYNYKPEKVNSTKEPEDEKPKVEQYTLDDALEDSFMDKDKLQSILNMLKHKKNIILQGPPGVGKTFIAKRLAYALMGEKDNIRIEMVQFHQSYSYDDFIQGYRPSEEGGLKRCDGIFYRFCKKAQENEEKDYYFIIDEINRGNLSKIFGELMMLIEKDKRGKEFAIPLTYSQDNDEKFYLPKNIHIIGTMNTADRSLAVVDYALRRRFAFITLKAAFEEPKFKEYLIEKSVDEEVISKIIDRLISINKKICEEKYSLGEGFEIGHSYFTPSEEGIYDNQWYEDIINFEVAPLLMEYLYDDLDKAQSWIDQLME